MPAQTGGIGVNRFFSTGSIPVWQGGSKDIQLAQGGFNLDKTGYVAGDLIPVGTPLIFNEATRQAVTFHSGTAQAAATGTATTYLANKGNTLKVGDNLASGNVGGKAYPITAIDRTNTAYDSITVSTSIGAVAAGDYLYASTATGATASAYPTGINGLLYEETIIESGILQSVSAVIRGTVYARRVPYSTALASQAGLDDIIYSQSF